MTIAVLYRWRVDPAKARQFETAWTEGTELIHEKCGSYGARLHKGEDHLYWSYALWPDEETRKTCFKDGRVTSENCFKRMQDAITEHFVEIPLTPCFDLLDKMPT